MASARHLAFCVLLATCDAQRADPPAAESGSRSVAAASAAPLDGASAESVARFRRSLRGSEETLSWLRGRVESASTDDERKATSAALVDVERRHAELVAIERKLRASTPEDARPLLVRGALLASAGGLPLRLSEERRPKALAKEWGDRAHRCRADADCTVTSLTDATCCSRSCAHGVVVARAYAEALAAERDVGCVWVSCLEASCLGALMGPRPIPRCVDGRCRDDAAPGDAACAPGDPLCERQ